MQCVRIVSRRTLVFGEVRAPNASMKLFGMRFEVKYNFFFEDYTHDVMRDTSVLERFFKPHSHQES